MSDAIEKLKIELGEKRRKSFASMYNLIVREWAGMYEDEEIKINPEYQRYFKWDNQRKTDLIESLLLGYPIPPIFVYKDLETGIWEVIDGLQRLSTIFEFLGKLKDEKGELLPPLKLNEGKLIKGLKNLTWNDLDKAIKFDFNKLSLPILELNSSDDLLTKYELFKRLNTGGMNLNYQEKRVPIIIALQPTVYKAFKEFASKKYFKEIFRITEKKLKEKEDMEYIVKYLVIKNIDLVYDKIKLFTKIEDVLDKGIEHILLKKTDSEIKKQLDLFEEILLYLKKVIDENYTFKSYTSKSGAILEYIFETVIYGLCNVLDGETLRFKENEIREIIVNLPDYSEYREKKGYSNLKPLDRLLKSISYSKEIFGVLKDNVE